MLTPVAIRRAAEQDLPALTELLAGYFAEGEVQHRDSPAALLAELTAPVLGFYVAEGSLGLAGCVLCHVLKSLADAAECKRLYVLPEARGGGLGGQLMEAAETAARDAGLGWMYLDSKDSFPVAMAMYKRRGYVECERFNDNPEAMFFFRKRLL